MRKWSLLLIVVAMVFLVCSCGEKAEDQAKEVKEVKQKAKELTEKPVINLGVAGAHSGDLASYGIPSIKAAELVVKDVNAKGGILGKKWFFLWKMMYVNRKLPQTPPQSCCLRVLML